MFEYYDIILEGNNKVTLTYKLERHRPAQVWAGLMLSAKIESLRSTLNPWRDFDKTILPDRVKYLQNLAEKMNTWLPESNKITGTWDDNDHQKSVNNFHIHFPEQEKSETDPIRRKQLSEYNDLIHEIEMLASKQNVPHLLICPDRYPSIDLEYDDFKLFTVRRFFGELCLQYCHVGRHPYELFMANDADCPIDQIVPQSQLTTFHTCRFYDNNLLDHYVRHNFNIFYQNSTLRDKIAFDDPKMAFGLISIGKLISNESQSDILAKVKSCNKIVDWKIY